MAKSGTMVLKMLKKFGSATSLVLSESALHAQMMSSIACFVRNVVSEPIMVGQLFEDVISKATF